MRHERFTTAETIAPDWVVCDRELDITDIWVDHMDTENVDGADVTIFLHEDKYEDGMTFKGIRVVDSDGAVTFWDRARCTKYRDLFSALCNVEDAAMQAPEYGSDDERDIRAEWV